MKELIASFYTWYKNALRNAKYRWIIVLGTLVYLVSPIDISPDFLPIVGWIDDGVLATLLVTEMSQIALGYLESRKQSARQQQPNNETDPVITVEAL
jgi:uncharacterized membrane protein YkvA (DUF1232 family)